MDSDVLQELYLWVDGIPLSRAKNHINRDFSDGGNSYTIFLLLFAFRDLHIFFFSFQIQS